PDGSLYVADWFNHRIQKFAPDGAFLSTWGGYGPKPGSLIFPRGITVTAGGDVVVTDSENNRIDVFDADGELLRSVKPVGQSLSRPHQTALDGAGGYWLADTNNNRVLHLGPDGDVLADIDITGSAATSKPVGIALDADGTVLVSNTRNNRVERFSASGDLLGTVATSGTGPGQVRSPGGLLVTGTGADRRLWIADAGNDRVTVLDADGEVETSFGTLGSGDGQLDQPRGVAVDPTDQEIAVADFANDRVSLWNSDGTAPPADTAPPQSHMRTPKAGAVLSGPTVSVTGTATDGVGVGSVRLLVKDLDTGLWVGTDGTPTSSWKDARRTADLTTPQAPSTDWQLDVELTTPGDYSFQARALDTSGNKDPSAAVRRVSVAAADTEPPEGVMTAPANASSVPSGPVQMEGAATDDVGVATVLLAIRDKETKRWLKRDLTWSTSYGTVLADLASPGATDTDWTYTFDPPGPGRYGVSVVTRDAAGNQDPTKPWINFTVDP
ncbi:MAG: Ig-like domain-containing protein, partial [Nocardioides sp.]